MARDYRLKELLPDFPRTPHLPVEVNLEEGDVVADEVVLTDILDPSTVWIEEKVDGANVGISYWKGNFYARNRREALRKGQLPKNPSGQQFKPLWNWLYEHQGNFQLLHRLLDFEPDEPVSIYGEWLWMAHGVHYTSLPSFFLGFDIYDPAKSQFLHHKDVRYWLEEAGFSIPALLHCGKVWNTHQLMTLRDGYTDLTKAKPDKREGIYIRFDHYKAGEPKRYKMVRPDFVRGKYWNEDEIVRNLLRKS